MKREEIIKLLLFLVICVVNLVYVFRHEGWRDEAQAWLIARDSSLITLFDVTSFEGHPCLWFLILMPFAHLGISYVSMSLIAYAFIVAAFWLIIYKLEFSIEVKALLTFTPMGLIFFVTPSRSYSVCAFFLVLLILAYNNRDTAPIIFGALLALLLQVHIIMGGFVVACGFIWGCSILLKLIKKTDIVNLKRQLLGLSLPVLSGVFLLWEFRDVNSVIGGFDKNDQSAGVLDRFIAEFFNDIDYLFSPYTVLPVCLLAVAIMIFLCIKSKENLGPTFIFLVSIAWQVGIDAFVYGCSYQIATWLYIFLWYLGVCFKYLPSFLKAGEGTKSVGKWLFTASCSVIVLIGVWTSFGKDIWKDLYLPYSASKAAARAVDELPEGAIVFENAEAYCNAVVAYVKKNTVYNPFTGKIAGYCDKDPEHVHSTTMEDFISLCKEKFPDAEGVYILCSVNNNSIEISEEEVEAMELCWSSQWEMPETMQSEAFDIRYLKFT